MSQTAGGAMLRKLYIMGEFLLLLQYERNHSYNTCAIIAPQ